MGSAELQHGSLSLERGATNCTWLDGKVQSKHWLPPKKVLVLHSLLSYVDASLRAQSVLRQGVRIRKAFREINSILEIDLGKDAPR